MRRTVVLQVIKIPAVLCGVWLLLHQAFRSFPIPSQIRVVSNDLSLVICIIFLLPAVQKLKAVLTRRVLTGISVLALGFFVLEIGSPESSAERILWFHSVRLFVSRASPFIGLLVLMFAWNPGKLTAIVLNPVRWWLALPRSISVAIAAFFALLGTAGMAWFGYGGMPRVDDGVANLYQARIFASGHLTLPAPPHPSGFSQFGVIQAPNSCSMFPPGYPLLLTLGVLIGLPWLVNPVLSGMTVLVVEHLAFTVFGRKTAALTALCLVVSPFLIVVGGSFMNHPLTLFLLAGATALLINARGRKSFSVGAGFLAGAAILARPYTAFLWSSGLLTAYVLTHRRSQWATVVLFGLGAMPGLVSAILFNLVQTGGTWVPAPIFLHGPEFALGLGLRATGEHTLLRAISHTTTRIEGLGRVILGWPFNLVLFPLAVGMLPGRRLFLKKSGIFLVAPPVFVLVGYSIYWGLEITHGPRFLYSGLCTLIPILAHTMRILPEKVRTLAIPDKTSRITQALAGGLLLSVIYSAAVSWPDMLRVFGDHYGCEIDLPRIVETMGEGKRLLFFAPVFENPHYGWAFLMNDLDFKGDVIVARDRGPEVNHEVMALFPNHEVLYYRYYWWERKGVLSTEPLPWWTED